jgi:hypothetical protein
LKRAYADLSRAVGCFAAVIWREIQLTSDIIHQSFERAESGVGLREDLAAITFLLDRQHEELLSRIKELFGSRVAAEDQQRIDELFAPLAGQPLTTKMESLRASLAARVRLCHETRACYDGHTRLVLRVQDCVIEQLILPTLAQYLDAAPAADIESSFVAGYRSFMPNERRHHDNFLEKMLSGS